MFKEEKKDRVAKAWCVMRTEGRQAPDHVVTSDKAFGLIPNALGSWWSAQELRAKPGRVCKGSWIAIVFEDLGAQSCPSRIKIQIKIPGLPCQGLKERGRPTPLSHPPECPPKSIAARGESPTLA